MSLSPINPSSSAAAAATSTSTQAAGASSSINDLANQNVFLQLLVAQLKNQNPDSPVDGTTFITQLAQFSELSNSTQELTNTSQMANNLASIQQELAAQAAAAAATPPATPPVAGVSNTSGTTGS